MTDANELGYKVQERRQQRRLSEQQQAENDGEQLRFKLFGEYRNEQLTRERANSDKYDSTILTYSTGALALSVSFIKDVVPLATAQMIWALKTSWGFFALTLLIMLSSFPIAQRANRKGIEFAHEYYIERNDAFYNRKGWEDHTLTALNISAGILFFLAILLTTTFVWTNVKEQSTMTDKKTISTATHAMDGMPKALMQKIPATPMIKGTPSASMQPLQASKTNQTPAPTSSSNPSPKQQK